MNRVLSRAARLIAILAEARGRPVGTGEVAQAAGLPIATTSRLLADLHDLGWSERHGLRGAWVLGPACQALARRSPYRSRLMQAAAPAAALARRYRCGVVLACLRGDHRITLIHHRLPGRPEGDPLPESWDVWETAGGRLLVALAEPRRRRSLIAAAGLPGDRWPGVLTREELMTELRAIASAKRCERVASTWSMAVPVPDGQGEHASLGVYVLGEVTVRRRRQLAAALDRTAEAVGRAMMPE